MKVRKMTIVVDILDEDALTREFERIRKILKTLRKDEVLRIEWGTKWAFEKQGEEDPAVGEFQKRIKEEFEMEDVDAIYPINIQAEDILAVVEEAKKEFPEVFYPPCLTKEGKIGKEDKPWCNPQKAAKWFLKWLADKEH